MPSALTPQHAKQTATTAKRSSWGHGLLMPPEVQYFSVTFKPGEAPVEVDEKKYQALPADKRKERWIFIVDPKPIRPSFTYDPLRFNVELPSKEWFRIVEPGIRDTVGGEDPISTFIERAASGTWFVEYEKVPTGQTTSKGTELSAPKFTRMTQELGTAVEWNKERYPSADNGVPEVVPLEVEEPAKLAFTRFAKKDLGKFEALIDGSDEFMPYKAKLLELAKGW